MYWPSWNLTRPSFLRAAATSRSTSASEPEEVAACGAHAVASSTAQRPAAAPPSQRLP